MTDGIEVGEQVPESETVIMSGLPMMAATGAQLAEIEGDYILTLTRPVVGHVIKQGKPLGVAQNRPVAEILMSRANVERLGKLIHDVLSKGPSESGNGVG